MERDQYQQIAIGAATLGIIAAIVTGRLPRRLRILVMIGVVLISAGVGLFGYRYYTTPATLTVAAGSLDGDAPRLLSAIGAKLVVSNAPVRLKVVAKPSVQEAAKALAAGDVDLAIVRADVGDLSQARTVVTAAHAVVMLAVPPGSSIESIDDLAGKTVGVVAGDLNRSIVNAISKEYELEKAKVHFRNVSVDELPQALKAKQVHAILVVTPVTEKYLAMLRNLAPRNSQREAGTRCDRIGRRDCRRGQSL